MLVVCGCLSEKPSPSAPAAKQAAPAQPVPAAMPYAPVSPDVRDLARPVAPQPAPAAPAPAAAQPPATPPAEPAPANSEMERVKAQKGVAAAGRSLDQYSGPIVTPAKAYFSVRERVVFEIQIPEALKLFKATNGQGPKSHDDFMTQIIEANQIKLPPVPPGSRYVYDPKTEELMVERPRQ
jgi:hypothetical protein